GVGKSTLVQDVLSACPFFVPYYAYLPDGEGSPRDRGEALTFFQDVVTRLDRFFPHRYSIGIADVAHGRSALREHMKNAIGRFLLDGFETNDKTTVAEAITAAGNYTGDIDQYYRSALSVPLTDPENKYLLALLCRAVPIIPTRWLQDWPERTRLERLYTQILAPFIREDNGQLYFIHNSLVAFLKEETRSKLPGADFEKDERDY